MSASAKMCMAPTSLTLSESNFPIDSSPDVKTIDQNDAVSEQSSCKYTIFWDKGSIASTRATNKRTVPEPIASSNGICFISTSSFGFSRFGTKVLPRQSMLDEAESGFYNTRTRKLFGHSLYDSEAPSSMESFTATWNMIEPTPNAVHFESSESQINEFVRRTIGNGAVSNVDVSTKHRDGPLSNEGMREQPLQAIYRPGGALLIPALESAPMRTIDHFIVDKTKIPQKYSNDLCFEAMAEMNVPTVHPYQPLIEAGNSNASMHSLLVLAEPLGMVVYEQHSFEMGNDCLTAQLLLMPTERLRVGTRMVMMEEGAFNYAIVHEQQNFEQGGGSENEAMVGMMEHAVCSYQPRIEAGHTSSSMQSLVLSIQPLRMAMEETVERYANHFSFYFNHKYD